MEPNRIMLEPSAAAAVVACSLSKQQQQQQRRNGEFGGVEEEKEELLLSGDDNNIDPSSSALQFVNFQRNNDMPADVGDEHGFRAQLETFTRALFGSCGSAIETAASLFGQGERGACRYWPNHHGTGAVATTHHRGAGGAAAAAAAAVGLVGVHHRSANHVMQQQHHYHYQQQPLSIAEELRQLAIAEGQNPNAPLHQPQQPRSTDIPRFLGEDAVHSIDDDNISAISQHTLEEMTRRGQHVHHHVHPMCTSNSSSKDHCQEDHTDLIVN